MKFRLGLTAVVWAIVVGALVGSDAQPQIPVLSGLVCIVMAGGFIAFDMFRHATPVVWARAPQPYPTTDEDEASMALVRQIQRGSRHSSWALRDTLLSLADERLLDAHGIDRATQPAAAHAVLGPGLLVLVEQQSVRFSKVADLDGVLDQIEAI